MGKLLTSIEQREKNRILEMYGISNNLVSEQLDPTPPVGSKIVYKPMGAPRTITGKLLSVTGTRLQIKDESTGSVIPFEKVRRNLMRQGSAYFDVISVTPPSRTRPPRNIPTNIPVPPQLASQRINFFACPDYDPNLSPKALDSILITKLEEVFPDLEIGREMEDTVGSFIKMTTNRKLVEGNPLIIYFICGYEGFGTNHDGTPSDDLNILLNKFENGRFAEKCNKPELSIDRTPAQSDQQKKIYRILGQKVPPPNIPPVPPSPPTIPSNLREDNNRDGIPTRVFSNTLHKFLTDKFCSKAWSQNRPQDDNTKNV